MSCHGAMVLVPLFRLGSSRDEVIEGWPWLDQVVLDDDLIADLELELAEGVNRQELELMPLGELPLAMGLYPEAPVLVGGVPGGRMWRCWCRIGAEWAARNSWSLETMHPVHKSKTRDSKCFCFAAEKLPLGADWPQCPLSPMPVPLRQADHPLTPWPR
jgi:hypothetical protein